MGGILGGLLAIIDTGLTVIGYAMILILTGRKLAARTSKSRRAMCGGVLIASGCLWTAYFVKAEHDSLDGLISFLMAIILLPLGGAIGYGLSEFRESIDKELRD